MDKVQIYYTIVLAVIFISNLITIAEGGAEHGVFHITMFFLYVFAILPIAGRIYGWW